MKLTNLFHVLNGEIANNHIQHVQLLLRKKDDMLIAKFVNCDNNHYKETVKKICNNFSENMTFLEETKTTMSYLI